VKPSILIDWYEKAGSGHVAQRVKSKKSPHVELQESGVSIFAMLEETEFLTSSSPPPSLTPDAIRTQRSPAVNTGTPAIPLAEGCADWAPPLLDPPDKDLLEQIQAPAVEEELSEFLPGEARHHNMRHGTSASCRRVDLRMREPSEWCTGTHPIFPIQNRKAPSCGGLSPKRSLVCVTIHGPTWASLSPAQMPVQKHQYCSRGSKTSSYHSWGASNMLRFVPLNHSTHPRPSSCHYHLKRSHTMSCMARNNPLISKDAPTPALKS
jgi:hypothetical protein